MSFQVVKKNSFNGLMFLIYYQFKNCTIASKKTSPNPPTISLEAKKTATLYSIKKIPHLQQRPSGLENPQILNNSLL